MSFLKTIWKASSKHKKRTNNCKKMREPRVYGGALAIEDMLVAKIQELSEESVLKPIKESEDKIEIDEEEIVTFKLKYLGSTTVEKIFGEKISPEAVKTILKSAKASRNKLISVNVSISPSGIAIADLKGNSIFKVSIYRISKCSTDASHRRIFSFVSTDCHETTECHAFLCSKRKLAETVTLAVAHAFSLAFEAWRILPSTKEIEEKAVRKEMEEKTVPISTSKNIPSMHSYIDTLIDFGDIDGVQENLNCVQDINSPNEWVAFEDDFSGISPRNTFNQVDLILA